MDMKNRAPNISRTGLTSRVTRPAASVSPMTTPMRKAPAAEDKPSSCAHSPSPKQQPSAASSSVSSEPARDSQCIRRGPSSVPKASAAMQKIASLPTSHPTPPQSADPVVATPESTVSSITAAKSSTSRMPTTVCPHRERIFPLSRSHFSRIAELLMAMAPPR